MLESPPASSDGRHRHPASGDTRPSMGREFDLIDRISARCTHRNDVVIGIGDDAAVLNFPPGEQLVISTDTLISGVHFPPETNAYAIGWKTLAVNLSDLAAMAATPRWCTLALTMPAIDNDWLDAFLDGFFALGAMHNIALVGGDTTRGPLSLTVTVLGSVPAGRALRRDGARVGDDIWVTGTLGDAACALQRWQRGESPIEMLQARLDKPTPRVAAGLALRELARSAIDISDGLLSDLAHVLRASSVGAEIELPLLPTSEHLLATVVDVNERWSLQVAGGDDYELCFSADSSKAAMIIEALAACELSAQRIGKITADTELICRDASGAPWCTTATGFNHFMDTRA